MTQFLSPFKFLEPFTTADRDAFFGRDREINTIYKLTLRTPLVLLYGLSGTGKTSLVQCGLASQFDGPDWLPLWIRRNNNFPLALHAALDDALPDEIPRSKTASAAEKIQQLYRYYLRPIYLLFDQVEEIFIFGTDKEQKELVTEIKQVLSKKLSCNVLLIIREEYLGRLHPMEKELPTLFDFRMRMEHMDEKHIKEVLSSSFKKFNIGLEAPEEKRLDEIINNVKDDQTGIIELPYLQIYLDRYYRATYQKAYRDELGEPDWPYLEFTRSEIKKFGKIEKILKDFLNEQCILIQKTLVDKFPEDKDKVTDETILLLLNAFISDEDTKRPIHFARKKGQITITDPKFPPLSGEAITFSIEQLEKSRILRRNESSIELAHDILTGPIMQLRSEELQQLIDVERRLRDGYYWYEQTNRLFDRNQLEYIKPFLGKVQLQPSWGEFLEASNKDVERLEKEKQERFERELRFVQNNLKAEQKAKQLTEEKLSAEQKAKELAEKAKQLVENNLKSEQTINEISRARTFIAVVLSILLFIVSLALLFFANKSELKADDYKKLNNKKDSLLIIVTNRVLQDIDDDIKHLNYNSALKKISDVKPFAGDTLAAKNISTRWLELAYWYNEKRSLDSAKNVLINAFNLIGRKINFSQTGRNVFYQTIRDSIKNLDPDKFQKLEERYYPKMILIYGGVDTIEDIKIKYRSSIESKVESIDTFFLAETETTWYQYNLFRVATNREWPDKDNKIKWTTIEGNQPVVCVSWKDAVEYANWLSKQKGLTLAMSIQTKSSKIDLRADGCRLPTEAEWDYAAKADTNFIYSGSNIIYDVAWYAGNSHNEPKPVRSKMPNTWGLYDMTGNVDEWCWDAYKEYPVKPVERFDFDLQAPGDYRVRRGGSWIDDMKACEISNRMRIPKYRKSSVRFTNLGFRVARSVHR